VTHSPWTQLARWSALVTAITVVVVVAGGTMVWVVERHAAGSNLLRWGDCLWWSVTTLTTVGYGEHYPVTLLGRMIAVAIMFSGVGIIGAVAAVVAFAFASRLTQRLEAAVSQVESQVELVEAEMENVAERTGPPRRALRTRSGLRELVIGVADSDTAASLTWLLARLGWHPEAGDNGVSWLDGGVLLRIAVRPWDTPFGVQGRLTFGAGKVERLNRIAREAAQHGFHKVSARGAESDGANGSAGAAVAAAVAGVAKGGGRRGSSPSSPDALSGAKPSDAVDVGPITLRTVSGFEVVLVTS
jgi:hypothetical protein